jgi:hypothetical protein
MNPSDWGAFATWRPNFRRKARAGGRRAAYEWPTHAPLRGGAESTPCWCAAATDATDTSHVLPQILKQDTVFPRKPESADEYIARIREQASQWANGLAP